jgi:Fe-S-cluster containining protein
MMKTPKKKHPKHLAGVRRLAFPEAETRYAWLPLLLDAYFITDRGVAEAIRLMQRKGHRLACARGCANCCATHRSIPVYPVELAGLSWYVTERLPGPLRARLIPQLQGHRHGDPCAFLIDGVCAVHSMRPMACRQFNVFNRVCAVGEDAYYTRREDVLTPLKKFTDQAFVAVMPFYGAKTKSESRRIVQRGLMHTAVRDLQQCEWSALVAKMDAWDRQQGENGSSPGNGD